MNVLLDNFPEYRDGFIGTVSITAISSVIALVLGVAIAASVCRPCPRCATSAPPG